MNSAQSSQQGWETDQVDIQDYHQRTRVQRSTVRLPAREQESTNKVK